MSLVLEASANFQLKVAPPCIGFLPPLCFHCDHCYSNRLGNHHIREVTCSAKSKKKKGLQSLRWVSLFAWLISRTFSANEQYFSLTTNQPTVFSAMTYQPNDQDSEM